MRFSTTRWTTAAAAAALIVVPGAAFAQTPPQSAPTEQTKPKPTQPQQPTPTPQPTQTPEPTPTPTPTPTQPPTATEPSADKPAASAQVDPAAAKQHLSEARDVLSQLTAMPEAAKLQGDARTQVSQLISNFNELITTQSNWRASYDKLDANLTSLLGAEGQSAAATPAPATGVAGATGTTGTTPAASALDPGIRTKLVEFRTHLKAFESAAGVNAAASTTSPSAAATPSEPAKTTPPAMMTTPPAAASDPAGAASAATAGSAASTMDQSKPASEKTGHAEADKELDAISAILNKSKSGTLTKAQTEELKKHVDQLRTLLGQSK